MESISRVFIGSWATMTSSETNEGAGKRHPARLRRHFTLEMTSSSVGPNPDTGGRRRPLRRRCDADVGVDGVETDAEDVAASKPRLMLNMPTMASRVDGDVRPLFLPPLEQPKNIKLGNYSVMRIESVNTSSIRIS